jgi:hypothetical protein
MPNIDFQHSFLYILSSLGFKFFTVLFLCLSRKFFVATVPRNKIKRKMKDKIAQQIKTTRKKWPSMLHVVGWHERIGWHQMFGKCIVGVAFIFNRKISSKMKLNVKNSRFKFFQRFSITTSEKRLVKFFQNLFFFFFFSKIRQFATKHKHCLQRPQRKILIESTNFANFPSTFFWDSPVVDNESYLVART